MSQKHAQDEDQRWGEPESLDSPGTFQPTDILARYSSVVTQVVCRLSWAASIQIAQDDLQQEGLIALLAAARTFDPGRGASFRTYAKRCVENALYGVIRAADPLPQKVRQDSQKVVEARMILSVQGQAATSHEALAATAGMSVKRVRQAVTALAFSQRPLELDESAWVWDRTIPTPEESAIDKDDADRVAHALRALPRRDRSIVIMRIIDGIPNHVVAQVHGVSPGRVSQVVNQTLDQLRAVLGEPHLTS